MKNKNFIARWMDGRLNTEEQESIEKSGELDALKTVIDDIDTWKVKPFDVEAGLAELQKKKSGVIPLRKAKKTHWMKYAATALILISCGLFWYLSGSNEILENTRIAEKNTIELPNGSIVEIDAASSISYYKKDWENSRELVLNGQAFFDVTKGKPFVVSTTTAKVAVLGTQFNIKTNGDLFSVYCYEGKIEVSYKNQVQIITEGQSIELKNDELIKSNHQDDAPDWIQGFSTYDKTPLRYVIADMQRYFEVEIALPEKYEQLQFTGTMTHDTLNSALSTVFTTMEINYTLENNKVIFY